MLPVGVPPGLGSSPLKLTPGAATSGFCRSPLSVAGSPPLEKPAIVSPAQAVVLWSSKAPTETMFHAVAGGPTHVVFPSLPAATYCESADRRTASSRTFGCVPQTAVALGHAPSWADCATP